MVRLVVAQTSRRVKTGCAATRAPAPRGGAGRARVFATNIFGGKLRLLQKSHGPKPPQSSIRTVLCEAGRTEVSRDGEKEAGEERKKPVKEKYINV